MSEAKSIPAITGLGPDGTTKASTATTGIFRKAAVQRLSSPEQLDYLITITSPLAWLAVWAAGAICMAIVLWGILGYVPNKVSGSGILIRGGAVFDVSAGVDRGSIREICVRPGQKVNKGDLIATLHRADLEEKIRLKQDEVDTEARRHADMTAREDKNDAASKDALNKAYAVLQRIVDDLTPQAESLNRRLQDQLTLQQRGLATKDQVLQARDNLFAVQRQISDSRVKQLEILSQLAKIDRETTQTRNARLSRIDEAKRQLLDYQSELTLTSRVTTEYPGRVVETLVNPGDPVVSKDRIVTIEAEHGTMQATLFVPAGAGKKIKEGMSVQIAPSTVRPEEYGFMLGKVTDVSFFPSTPDEMHRVLRNDQLVRELLQYGTPIEIHAELIGDATTISGFRWSSKAPNVEIHTGTLCKGNVITDRKRPIEYVIPKIKEVLGIQ
ncbi:MAG: NHLP bacteriocin system secretion protein [Verrucomicrobia bacterium]|nr:NHLP bacteriocin system secretion protein [Verrucomicrobiota bacterium]